MENTMPHVDYEVACQTIGQLIAHYVAVIAEEESRSKPDAECIAIADAERKTLVAARDALHPDDAAAIARALDVYGRRARRLNIGHA
ncbi:hypothetical protein ABEG10_37550 (plasmid) [Burkholderia cenocepacia]|uniref:hypothetical protein n=1 Tax=Burkholderia cepacia complex TaxID=87882 RepID=UPI00190412AD|nr:MULTISPECIES: hypothetical protein [Burkholderia cepacia complex]MBK1824291.1 hypothetical protein [Burkholderia orbicola]MCO8325672.1 hypothetical protein [Burkholderia cenocepacia]MCO8332742.1 hypothetical protein [Burkholderia cenocepacia]MCO8340242.1 hypothetical protein [Burkholderia cenocepacia]MCO8347528.1 hypothetical protein [Burkholderia cenocepacia]